MRAAFFFYSIKGIVNYKKRKLFSFLILSERGDFLVISLPLSKQLIINILFFISNFRLLVNNTRFRTRVWTKKLFAHQYLD